MDRPRWPLIAAVVALVVVVGAAGWTLGRSGGSDSPGAGAGPAAIRTVGGVPIGVLHTRAGALAASDNYVATSSETVIQDPGRFERLVRSVYSRSYQSTVLRKAGQVRAKSPRAIARYEAGARAVALIGARRLGSYDGARAVVTTWRAGVIWGPSGRAEARWFLSTTRMRWHNERWLIELAKDVPRPAPAPVLVYNDPTSLKSSTFERELRGMTAPTYGADG